MIRRGRVMVMWTALYALSFVGADDPKPADPPVVRMVVPLGIRPASTTRLTIRGRKLEGATAVRLTAPGAIVKLLESGKADVPNGQDAKRVGDTRVEVEVTTPANLGRPPLALFVETPAGETEAHPLLTEPADTMAEVEPNDGFRQAQVLPVPGAVDGRIERAQDVDVYRVQLHAGQTLHADIRAARHGSALDGWLTVYDAKGRLIASADDRPTNNDPQLELTIPREGAYFLVVSDALDQGGPAHPYRLVVHVSGPNAPR